MSKNLPKTIHYIYKPKFTQNRRPYKKYSLAKWSEESVLNEALLLKETENNYLNIISGKYGIVKSTLKHKLQMYIKYGKSSLKDNRGHNNRLFTEDDEKILAERIKNNYIAKELPFDNGDLKILAENYWNELNRDDKIFKASNGWCTDFKKKWGLSSVKPSMKKRQYENNNEIEINNFIDECKREFDNVGATNFYNMDETFWRIINGVQTTFGCTGTETTKISYSGNEKEGFTAIFCINASGKFLEPIIIKKGKTAKCLESINIEDNIQKCYSNNGWVNNGIMICLLDKIKEESKNEAVLLLDKFPIHNNDYVKDEAIKRNIKLIFIPSNMTSKYQPLDVGINGPLKSYARKLWKEERLKNPDKIPKLIDGVKHLSCAIKEIINEELVIKSFEKALPFLWNKENKSLELED